MEKHETTFCIYLDELDAFKEACKTTGGVTYIGISERIGATFVTVSYETDSDLFYLGQHLQLKKRTNEKQDA